MLKNIYNTSNYGMLNFFSYSGGLMELTKNEKMKIIAIFGVFTLLAFGAFSQTTKSRTVLKKSNTQIKKLEAPKPVIKPAKPGMNNATESNRKRPGGTISPNTNSKKAAPKPKTPPAKSGTKKD